jgi:hypothetical protein
VFITYKYFYILFSQLILLFYILTDTEKPVINNCPTTPISIRKYEALPPRLPQLTVTDNTAIRSFTISPSNANTTYFVSNNLQVVYTATDFDGNVETCTVNVEVTGKLAFFLIYFLSLSQTGPV